MSDHYYIPLVIFRRNRRNRRTSNHRHFVLNNWPLSSNTTPNYQRWSRWEAGTKSQHNTQNRAAARGVALFMWLTKYRSAERREHAPPVPGSSSASRELCCSATESFTGKLPHKQVERATKAFWRQPTRNILHVYDCEDTRMYVYVPRSQLPQKSSSEWG